MTQPHSSTSHCSPTAAMTPGQTLMWFLGGIAAMFVIVSIAFGIKLATEGRLSLFGKGSQSVALQTSTSLPPDKPVPDNEPVTPPVSAATVSPGTSGGFVSGSENILPPEAAHLAKSPVEASAAPLPTEAAHASTPAAAPPASSIPDALEAWAADWTHKDVTAYLAHYASDFKPANGLDRQAWIAQRKQRLAKPETISVTISDLDIKPAGDKASARFTQTYRAGEQNLRETKTLELTLRDGQWLIQQERIGS